MVSAQSKPLGVLLVNLGTPEGTPTTGPSAEQVKVYLREFLMDPYVIDIPFPLRWILVNALILPRRSELSAEAYRKIWTERGSPLLFHHLDLSDRVSAQLGAAYRVEPAMRYGNPSIPAALDRLVSQGVDEIQVVPLYPQYSLAATESTLEICRDWQKRQRGGVRLNFHPAFYRSPQFIEAFARVAEESLRGYEFEHLLFSFHGLPERHVKKTDRSRGEHCLASRACCDEIIAANQDCYRAQCFSTARLLAVRLGLSYDRYTVCFQSRLGRSPWVKPYTDHVYQELASRGIKRVAVMCPAFVADCLETLEEVQMRGREDFIRMGGEDLRLIPSLNAHSAWVSALSGMIQDQRVKQGVRA